MMNLLKRQKEWALSKLDILFCSSISITTLERVKRSVCGDPIFIGSFNYSVESF